MLSHHKFGRCGCRQSPQDATELLCNGGNKIVEVIQDVRFDEGCEEGTTVSFVLQYLFHALFTYEIFGSEIQLDIISSDEGFLLGYLLVESDDVAVHTAGVLFCFVAAVIGGDGSYWKVHGGMRRCYWSRLLESVYWVRLTGGCYRGLLLGELEELR